MSLQLDKISILIAEDSKPMNELLKAIIEKLDVKNLYTAYDGERALDLFMNERPDIVISDWMMDPMDGIELTNRIRLDPESPNRIAPVIMLTGYNSAKRVMIARDAGCTEFLVKPFTAKDLAKRLAYVINNPRDFIECREYFGPDRRRRIDFNHKGPFRRASDSDILAI